MNAKDAILRMPRRADKWEEDMLVKTFVNIGPLIPILRGTDNHVLYGRRGEAGLCGCTEVSDEVLLRYRTLDTGKTA